MTEKQQRTINFIEHMLEIRYEGKSDKEAWEFIGRNLNNARKCAFFESQISMPVFSAEMGIDKEPDLDLKRDLSRVLLIRDIQKGKTTSESMSNFAENLFLENL